MPEYLDGPDPPRGARDWIEVDVLVLFIVAGLEGLTGLTFLLALVPEF